jgi:hypothetical protein
MQFKMSRSIQTGLLTIESSQSIRPTRTLLQLRTSETDPPTLESETCWGRSSVGRASRSQCEGRRFDPSRLHHFKSLNSIGVLPPARPQAFGGWGRASSVSITYYL